MSSRTIRRTLGVLVVSLVAVAGTPAAGFGAAGDQLWAAKYHAPGNHDDSAQAVAAGPDGQRVFVTGDTFDRRSYLTIAYNAVTGAQLWVAKRMGARSANSGASDIAVGPTGGRVYVTGALGSRNHGYDFGTIAYDAATGAPLWERRYDGPIRADDLAWGVAVSPNGHVVYVTGDSEGPAGAAATTIAYDSKTGAEQWTSREQFGQHEAGTLALAVSPDGSRLYASGSEGVGAQEDVFTLAYNAANGTVV
jgi:outer membrane protein assembly factor BamB